MKKLSKNKSDFCLHLHNRGYSVKKVLLINGSVYLPGEGGYKRTMYLFDMMRKMGYSVTLLTSDFNHYAKRSRDVEQFRRQYPDYKNVEMVHMPEYSKNISLKRYYSGMVYSDNVRKWCAEHLRKYDVVMTSMPAIGTIKKIHPLCEKFGVKMLIDVRDLHPEAFRVVVKNDLLYRFLFYGMKRSANKAYSFADEMIAVSEEYLRRGMSCNKKAKNPMAVYIGSALEKFDAGVKQYAKIIEKPADEIWLTYAGTLGASYDLITLIRAAKELQDAPNNRIRIKILGQGPDEGRLKQFVKDTGVKIVDFIGFKPYEEMAAFLSVSDMTINSVKKNGSQSIINKVADYFAAGIPMINGCSCTEQQVMVDKYHVGLNYEPENVDALVAVINILAQDSALRQELGNNARNLAMSKFDRKTSYLDIIKTIEAM